MCIHFRHSKSQYCVSLLLCFLLYFDPNEFNTWARNGFETNTKLKPSDNKEFKKKKNRINIAPLAFRFFFIATQFWLFGYFRFTVDSLFLFYFHPCTWAHWVADIRDQNRNETEIKKHTDKILSCLRFLRLQRYWHIKRNHSKTFLIHFCFGTKKKERYLAIFWKKNFNRQNQLSVTALGTKIHNLIAVTFTTVPKKSYKIHWNGNVI